jgi:hypothetical protein
MPWPDYPVMEGYHFFLPEAPGQRQCRIHQDVLHRTRHDFDFAYLQALAQAISWAVRDGVLLLKDESGDSIVTCRMHQE